MDMIKRLPAMMVMAVAALMPVSCGDFLERAPGDNMTEEEIFSKIETAERYLDNAYIYLPDFQYNTEDLTGRYKLGDATDEGGFQQSSGYPASPFDINLGSWNPVQMPMERNWSDYYGCIRRCNMFIRNYDRIPEDLSTGGGSNRRQRLLGEAYGLRGYFYFLLFKQWGGVPIITSVLEPGNVESLEGIRRASAGETLKQVISDMDEAARLLPAKHDASNFGRFTSLVAAIVKSQARLYWASPYWNRDDDAERWEEAAEAARIALNMAEENGHILSLKYSDLFNREGIEPEVIWTKNSEHYECYWWDVYAMPLGYNAYNVDGPLQELVDDFEMKVTGKVPVLGYNPDNTQIVDLSSGYDPEHPWDGRDDRFYSCILYHGAELQGRKIDISATGKDNINIGSILRTNYFNNKYLDQNHNLVTHASWTYRRFAIMRTGELILNYAEALNEVEGPTARVYALVHRIRGRAGQPNLPSGLDKDAMRERIRHERRIELAFENHRFWDVRRWMIAEEVDNGAVHRVTVDADGKITYPVFQNRVFNPEKHYLFPIPQSEIDKNRALEQNPGW
ncbi:MAG: RagB/SusD family nutrient uptake outer membrane protein [Clostridium sp.]|nr:RagB/SusD family nutrient uptake outer membrane protein [Bacteroides sp.]MCM1199234.1 RagB/SusD family nutrient uptake outer membrane protein [Clostridium sp.]